MSFAVVSRAAALFASCEEARRRGERVAFVPTMGALHAGHVALVHEARRRAAYVVVSVFVNPTQFGPGEDLAQYPRKLAADVALLEKAGAVNAVFSPDVAEMYPPGDETRVRVGALAEPLCGPFRPGHFEGVATVVAKLLSVVGACDAVFGRKDYQQLLVVRRLALDLRMPVRIVDHPIVREGDGLAMSSRNAYLSEADRVRARSLPRGLDRAARAHLAGERDARTLEHLARAEIVPAATSIDYVELRDATTLGPVGGPIDAPAVLAIAARYGATRLIDNVVLGEDPPPLEATKTGPLPTGAR